MNIKDIQPLKTAFRWIHKLENRLGKTLPQFDKYVVVLLWFLSAFYPLWQIISKLTKDKEALKEALRLDAAEKATGIYFLFNVGLYFLVIGARKFLIKNTDPFVQ